MVIDCTYNDQLLSFFLQALEEEYNLYIQYTLMHTEEDLGPLQYLR